MAIFNEQFADTNVGRLVPEDTFTTSDDSTGIAAVGIEADSSGNCTVVLPAAQGYPVALAGWPIANAPVSPSANFTLTITDKIGRTWSYTINKDGANDHFTSLPGLWIGELRFAFTGMTANSRFRLALFAQHAYESFPRSSPLTTLGDTMYRDASADARLGIGSANDIYSPNAGIPAWRTRANLGLYYSDGTDVAIADGGTGQSTAAAGFNALSPLTTQGDILYGGASGAGTRLAIGTAGQELRVNSGATAPEWFARKNDWDIRDSTVAQTYDRALINSTTALLSTGALYLCAIGLRAYRTITNLEMVITAAGGAQTNWWFVLIDSSRVVKAVTADQLTASPGTGRVSVALGSAFTPGADGQYWVGFMFVGGSMPTVGKATVVTATQFAPIVCGSSNTGMTTPPAVNDTMNALTAITSNVWMGAT